jgi:DNA (cytosine-5)-methyltransferase 1
MEKVSNDNSKRKRRKKKSKPKLRMADLCAGTGAFSLGFESTGLVDIVYINDFDISSKIIYDRNFNHELTLGDLNEIKIEDIPPHDILTSGFPCQPFSISGRRKGFDDSRTNVLLRLFDIMKYHKPKCVVLENVKNLLTHNEGKSFDTIRTNLKDCGYHTSYKVLNTVDVTGIPLLIND